MINLILDILLGWLIDFVQLLFNGIFSVNLDTILTSFQDPETINGIIPHFSDLINAMSVIGYVFLALNAYSIILKALIAQLGGSAQTENPIKSMFKILFAGVMIGGKSYIMQLIAELYSRFIPLMPAGMEKIDNLTIWGSLNAVTVFARIVMLAMFAFAAAGAALSYFERVISFLVFLYTYPVAMAFSVNKETSDMFRQWIAGVLSQMILIVLSTGMLYIGITIYNSAVSRMAGLDIFKFVLAVNAMNLVKNSEKILNMYNIRTMPNTATAGEVAGAFGKALAFSGAAIGVTSKLFDRSRNFTAGQMGGSAAGAATPEVGTMSGYGRGLSGMINPSGSVDPIIPSGGSSKAEAFNATRDTAVKTRGKDFATRTAKVNSMDGVNETSDIADRLKVAEAVPPSNPQILQEAANQKLMTAATNDPKSVQGAYLNKVRGEMNLKSFTAGVNDAISDINGSRKKVNSFLEENRENASDGFAQAANGELEAEDVYKAYGMANDPTLKDFSPDGFAVPLYKDGSLQGLAIKGQQKNARTGVSEEQIMLVSSSHTSGAVGGREEWRRDGYHALGQNVYASRLSPVTDRPSGNDGQKEAIRSSNLEKQDARNHMEWFFNNPTELYRPAANTSSRRNNAAGNASSSNFSDIRMEQPDKTVLEHQMNEKQVPDDPPNYGEISEIENSNDATSLVSDIAPEEVSEEE